MGVSVWRKTYYCLHISSDYVQEEMFEVPLLLFYKIFNKVYRNPKYNVERKDSITNP